jgi:hypothetical protein
MTAGVRIGGKSGLQVFLLVFDKNIAIFSLKMKM